MISPQGLSWFDAAIAAAYVAAILGLGVFTRRVGAGRGAKEYFLAGRSARWPMIGLSLVASNISPTALVGVAGAAYATGVAVYNYEWIGALVLLVFAVVFLPTVLRSGLYTMPEFLERRFDRRLRLWFSALTLFMSIILDAAGVLYATTLFLRLLAPDMPAWFITSGLAGLAGLYVLTGGLRAVIYTEALQAFVVLGGALLLTLYAVGAAGGITAILADAGPASLSLVRPADDPHFPWTGLLFGAPLLGFYFWCTNQFMVQRMLAARGIPDGQKGAVFGGLLKLTTLFVLVLPGLAAASLHADLPQADLAYPTLVLSVLPPGLTGLVVAAFLGALMAQLSAAYSAAGVLFAMDFVKPRLADPNEAGLIRWGRIGSFAALAVSAAWAPQIARFESLWAYLQAVMAYLTPPMIAVFAAGFLLPRATTNGAVAAAVGGTLLGGGLFLGNATGAVDIHFLVVAGLLFATSLGLLLLVSAAGGFPRPPIETRTLLVQRRDLPLAFRDRTFALMALLLVGAIAVILTLLH